MHSIYKHSILKILERIFAIVVPIIFVMIERYFIEKPTYRILDAYVLTQFVQVILGASVFLVFYKKNINIWSVKLYQVLLFSSFLIGFILYQVTENVLVLFSVSYIACIPLELQNVFLGRHYKNLFNRFISISCAILIYIIFGSIELSYASERSVFAVFSIFRNRDQKQNDVIIGWREAIANYQILPIYITGLLTVVYGKLEQLYLLHFGDNLQFANYIITLRLFDVAILALNSLVLARINSAIYDLRAVRRLVDVVSAIFVSTMCVFTLVFPSFAEDMLIISLIILLNYYFMSWGVIKALYTHHNMAHMANLRCQAVGIFTGIFYFLVVTRLYDWDALPFVTIVAVPAVGQIGANLIGPLMFKPERKFLSLLFYKESDK